MATAAKTATDAKARSIELATAKGHTSCSHAARIIGWTLDETTGGVSSAAWRICSAHSDEAYVVTYTSGGIVACECRAAQYHRPCWHAGLGWMLAMELVRIYSPVGRAAALQEQRAAEMFDSAAGRRGAAPIVREEW